MSVSYELQVYVKHDAWTEFGKGKFVAFPIKIVSKVPDDVRQFAIAEQQRAAEDEQEEIVSGYEAAQSVEVSYHVRNTPRPEDIPVADQVPEEDLQPGEWPV